MLASKKKYNIMYLNKSFTKVKETEKRSIVKVHTLDGDHVRQWMLMTKLAHWE